MTEAELQQQDRRLDDLIEALVLAAYSAQLPDDPDVQAAVDELGEYIAEVRVTS
jgi:hypothetical protein